MQKANRFRRATLLSAVIVLVATTNGSAGIQEDPNLGDDVLGTAGGVRYASERVTYDDTIDHADIEVGCGGPRWHMIGGGSAAGGPVAQAWQTTDRPTDWAEDDGGDTDADLDDGWRGAGTGTNPAQLTAYSICMRDGSMRYPTRIVAPSPTALRTSSVGCGGRAWHVTAGSAFISTTGSWIHSSYPRDGADADHRPDDGWNGAAFDTLGGGGGYYVHAVCVRGEALRYVRRAPAPVAAGAALIRRAACGADEHVVGGGVRISGPQDRARLVSSFPYDDGDPGSVPDDGWQGRVYNVSGGAKQVTAFAVCLG